jgi:ankyrin repeat protein
LILYYFRHAACSYGEVDLIRYLVSRGANIELQDNDGDTPILVCETPEVFELLVELGANPNVKNKQNEGIAEKVLDDDNLIMIQYLVQKGLLDESAVLEKYNMTEEELIEQEGEGEEEDGDDHNGEGQDEGQDPHSGNQMM